MTEPAVIRCLRPFSIRRPLTGSPAEVDQASLCATVATSHTCAPFIHSQTDEFPAASVLRWMALVFPVMQTVLDKQAFILNLLNLKVPSIWSSQGAVSTVSLFVYSLRTMVTLLDSIYKFFDWILN